MSRNKSTKEEKLKEVPEPQKKFKTYWSANPLKMYSHIPRLYQWYNGKDIYPISIEIGLTSLCNHNCCWCSIKAKKVGRHDYLAKELLEKFVRDIKQMEVKSVVISGSGEQTLHPGIKLFLTKLRKSGINIGLNSNGSNLTPEICEKIVDNVTWVRISLDASSQRARKHVHGVKDLHKTVEGLERLVALKKERNSNICIGTQMVICSENENEIESVTRLASKIGVDYLQIKPVTFFEHYPEKKNSRASMKKWMEEVKKVVSNYSRPKFQINVRYDQFIDYIEKGMDQRKEADIPCLTGFSPYIEADGNVWYCVDKKGFDEYWLGNLNVQSLKTIWNSDRRKEVLKYVEKNHCNRICRNAPLNEFLWGVKNPTPFYDFL